MKTLTDELKKFNTNDSLKRNLINNYHEALKDDCFKELVERLNLDEELLIKYTTTLEDSAVEYKNCKNCKSIYECKNKVAGYAFLPLIVDERLDFSYQACRYQKKIIKENNHLNNISLFEMPFEIKNAKMKEIYHDDESRFETLSWINNFIKVYNKNKHLKGLYLHGSFGSGKTYLIAAMFNELAKNKVKSAIVYWPEFLRDLKASFATDFKEKFEYVKKVPLLLLDDIGAESTTEWSRDEILGPILQYRMQMKLPTFFTSNLDIKSLEMHFSITKDRVSVVKSKRIMERIKELTDEIELIGKNLRN